MELEQEGYVYVSYGKEKYLQHVVASVSTLRRYDQYRPVAIVCPQDHIDILKKNGLHDMFQVVHPLPEENASITGFKHNLEKFVFFKKSIYLDSDIVWCKNPDRLWQAFSPYPFTITGKQLSDSFFGAAKGIAVVGDILLKRRERTLKRFGLTYLSRIQSGLIYVEDKKMVSDVCSLARDMLKNIDQTHFKSRLKENGRNMESCEWSLAMAMSKLDLPVYPWFNGQYSAQLDFLSNYTKYDKDFKKVACKYYSNSFVYSLRGLKTLWIQNLLTKIFTFPTRNSDFMYVTPYCLHFGWLHEKQPFLDFSDRVWEELTTRKSVLA